MLAPRALVLRAPGTNCDHETAHAFERADVDAAGDAAGPLEGVGGLEVAVGAGGTQHEGAG